MYHIVYLFKNIVNGKIYVGVHSTYNLSDNYQSSSPIVRKAFKKYGKDKFERTILHFCLSRLEALQWEEAIVDNNFIQRKDTYNVKIGGQGGLLGFTHTTKTKEKMSNSKKNTPKKICKFCNKEVDAQNYKILHDKYCEQNPNRIQRKKSTKLCIYCNIEFSMITYSRLHGEYCMSNPNRKLFVLPKKICEYCGKETDSRNYSRFHGTNCNLNPNQTPRPKKICEYCGKETDSKNYTRFHGVKCKHYLLSPTASQ